MLSVRGEAHRTAPPDSVTLSGRIRVSESGRSSALAAAAAALERLTSELAEAGGVPLRIDSQRAALSWSAFSATTEVEWRHDKRSGESTPTGRVFASVDVALAVRDFGLLEPIGRLMTNQGAFDVHYVSWEVDDDNPEWRPCARTP